MEREHERAVRHRIGAMLVILALVLALASLGLLIYYATLPPPPGPHCGYGDHASARLQATETLAGYRVEISSISRNVPLDCYKVVVIKNGTPLFPDLPTNVTEGVMGVIQGGENLNFTDSDGNGRLTVGDYFTLERLDPDTYYEVMLLWASSNNVIEVETAQTP